MLCTQVTQISHSTVGSSFSVSFSASPNELDMLYAMRDFFKKWNMSGISFKVAEQTEPTTEDCSDVGKE